MNTLLTLVITVAIWITCGHTTPVFGDEYVHIKVHVPHETPVKQPPSIRHIEGHPQQVVHHYHHHHRRRLPSPSLKKPTAGRHNTLLDSIVVSELARPEKESALDFLGQTEEIAEHIAKPAEQTYVVKYEDLRPKKTVDTYTVVEESVQSPSRYRSKSHIEKFSIHDAKEPVVYGNTYKHDHRAETIKILEAADTFRYKPQATPITEETGDSDEYHGYTGGSHGSYHYEEPRKSERQQGRFIKSGHPAESKRGGGYANRARSKDTDYSYQTHSIDDYRYEPQAKSVKVIDAKLPNSHRYRGHVADLPKDSVADSYHEHHRSQHNDGKYTSRQQVWDAKPSYHEDELFPPHKEFVPSQPAPIDSGYHSKDNHSYQQEENDKEMEEVDEEEEEDNDDNNTKPITPAKESRDSTEDRRSVVKGGYKVTETYSGYNSYNANHVQGLGSGGYKYPAASAR